MKLVTCSILTAIGLTLSTVPAMSKDDPIRLEECPAAVQAVVNHYKSQGTLESVEVDQKKKTGGPAVYEAKFLIRDGKRVEIHISADGKVLKFENKKAEA